MNNELTIYKDNYLVEASYRLTLMEQRIMLYAISRLNPKAPEREHSFYVDDLLKFFPDIDPSSAYRALRDAIYKLSERWIKTEHPEYIKEFRWVSSRTYFKDEGRIDIAFTPEIMPYLSQLEQQFTKYQLKNISAFKGSYSIRLYELLTQYKSRGNRGVSVKELREWLQIGDKYPQFKVFKQWVINPAIKEINEKSDLNIEFDTIIQRRTVVALLFIVTPKNTAKSDTKRPRFPYKNKYGRYVFLNRENPRMSNHEYGLWAKDCLRILNGFYQKIEDVSNEDLLFYWIFLSVNQSNKSKLGTMKNFADELKNRGYKIVNCELERL